MSQSATVTCKVRPSFYEEPARLFENYPRLDSFAITDEQGSQTCALLATAMFLKDHRIVRPIEHEGELAGVTRHMAGQWAIRELEELRTEFLEVPRDTSGPTAFRDFFLAHSMRCKAAQRHDQPAAAVSQAREDR
jgi:SchA/CurD like domain